MDHIFRGQPIEDDRLDEYLDTLDEVLEEDLQASADIAKWVMDAMDTLIQTWDEQSIIERLFAMGITQKTAHGYIQSAKAQMNKAVLEKRIKHELKDHPHRPLGVLVHVGAANTLGLSAFSVIEGLLTGNINLLKLPRHEGGLSTEILCKLMDIQPKLKPYIYILDIASSQQEQMDKVLKHADGLAVWGDDETLSALRSRVSPTTTLIEWGHRYSFCYMTPNEGLDQDIKEMAEMICRTDQLYCSTPQCVFFETDDHNLLDKFAQKLAGMMEEMNQAYPAKSKDLDTQANITWTQLLSKTQSLFGKENRYTDEEQSFGVMTLDTPQLKISPLYRNIWVMPAKREEMFSILRKHKGHLQTVGLSCSSKEEKALKNLFYAAGATRIVACGQMDEVVATQPHDGQYSLQRYVKMIV